LSTAIVRFVGSGDAFGSGSSVFSCRRIILTHMTPHMLARDDIAFERANDGLEITF